MSRLSCVALVFISSLATAAASTIALGPEQPSSYLTFQSQGTAPGASIASDGDSFMTAWPASYSAGHGSIFLQPLDANGNRQRMKTLSGFGEPQSLSIYWTGSAYRLVWANGSGPARVHAADVNRDGDVVTPPYLLNGNGYVGAPWDSSATIDRTLVTSFFFGLFDASGTLLGVAPMPTTKLGAGALDKTGATVFWVDTDTLYARRIDRDGKAGLPAVIAQVHGAMQVAATASGGATEVVVAEGQPTTYRIRRFRVDAGLSATALPGFTGSPHVPGEVLYRLRIVPDGAGFLVYWVTSTSLYSNRRGDTIEWWDLSDDFPRKVPIPELTLAAGTIHVVGVNRNMSAFVLDATPAMTPVKLFPIGTFPVPQRGNAITSTGEQSLVVWSESRTNADGTSSPIVMGSLLAADGSRIGDLLPIGLGGDAQVIAVGSEYWVFWSLASPWGNAISLRRVRPDGSMSEPQFYWNATGTNLRVATNGSLVLVAFRSNGANVVPALEAVRFNISGEILDSTPLRLAAGDDALLASNGDSFLLAFVVDLDPCLGCHIGYGRAQAVAARLDASGNLIDIAPIAVSSPQQYPNWPTVEGVGSDGRDYLIVFVNRWGLFAKRIAREGVLVDGIAADNGVLLDAQTQPRNFTVEKMASGYLVLIADAYTHETRVIQTDFHGNPIEAPVTISGRVFAVSRSAAGFLVAYTRPADEPEAAGATRVFTRTLTLDAPRLRAVRRY